jgi:hypothetical protein
MATNMYWVVTWSLQRQLDQVTMQQNEEESIVHE